MVLQLSVPALSWIYTKYKQRYYLKNHEKVKESNRRNEQKLPKENLSASPSISTVLTNSLTTDKLTSQVLATIDYRKKICKASKATA